LTIRSINIAPDVIFREIGGETVILNLKTERYLGLDEVGTRIWEVLQATGSVESTLKILLEEYDVEPSLLERDLNEFIDKLIENGLVTTRGTGLHGKVPGP
jgi:hypothetical protein